MTLSPAEVVSRLYPSLAPERPPKISSDTMHKLRQNLKAQPPRITKHEIVLFQREPSASAATPKNSRSAGTPSTTAQPSSSSVKAAMAEKSFNVLWSLNVCSPEKLVKAEDTAVPESPRAAPTTTEPAQVKPKTTVSITTGTVPENRAATPKINLAGDTQSTQ